jgi:hypothetical protein
VVRERRGEDGSINFRIATRGFGFGSLLPS